MVVAHGSSKETKNPAATSDDTGEFAPNAAAR